MNDPMRIQYKKMGENEAFVMKGLKEDFDALYRKLDSLQEIYGALNIDMPASSRELSIAKTKLEEACMWAVKHITA